MEFNVLVISRWMVEHAGSAIEGYREATASLIYPSDYDIPILHSKIIRSSGTRQRATIESEANSAVFFAKNFSNFCLRTKGKQLQQLQLRRRKGKRWFLVWQGINMTLLKRYDAHIFLLVLFQQVKWLNFGELLPFMRSIYYQSMEFVDWNGISGLSCNFLYWIFCAMPSEKRKIASLLGLVLSVARLSKDQLGVTLIHLTLSIDFKASLGLDADT
ncbi:LOW QUALITY PROTEIN: hypothetical protein Cgig2_001136 [Carnegiea gigantea]|uniref:Uncharacterized protein n=1 Tax=Carnegiea gigantea TaxID=171969 RepID=A0A9Q1GN64_9CARY|nr:LOW QUALITY PROTEIN: hypothetical protein Cgig2_001136 [Carnegiea gigantea]